MLVAWLLAYALRFSVKVLFEISFLGVGVTLFAQVITVVGTSENWRIDPIKKKILIVRN